LTGMFLPMTLFFIYRASIVKRKKILLFISYGIILLLGVGVLILLGEGAEFMVHAVLIAYDEPNRIIISIDSRGSQPDFELFPLELVSFSVGAKSDDIITITKSGNISGYITLQTVSGATASCVASTI